MFILSKTKKVYTPGVWDLLHVGHINFLNNAKFLGTELIVGVASDDVVKMDKGVFPTIPQDQRLLMLRNLCCVDASVIYEELDFIAELKTFKPQIMAVGCFWGNEKRHVEAEDWCEKNDCLKVILPYTKEVSTTKIKEKIRNESL